MLQTQPVLFSPKAHRPAQQLDTPSSQPWKASSQDRQLVTTTLGQGRSLFGELLNTAVTENLANERNPSLLHYPNPSGQDGQCSTPAQHPLLPVPCLPTALCHLYSTLSTMGCRAPGHRWSAGGSRWVPQSTGGCRAPGPGSHRGTPLVTCTPKTEQLC